MVFVVDRRVHKFCEYLESAGLRWISDDILTRLEVGQWRELEALDGILEPGAREEYPGDEQINLALDIFERHTVLRVKMYQEAKEDLLALPTQHVSIVFYDEDEEELLQFIENDEQAVQVAADTSRSIAEWRETMRDWQVD